MSDTNELRAVKLTKAQADLIEAALIWANFSAGEGICAYEDTGIASPEDFLMAYTNATGDEDWDTAHERVMTSLRALSTSDARAPSVEEGKHG